MRFLSLTGCIMLSRVSNKNLASLREGQRLKTAALLVSHLCRSSRSVSWRLGSVQIHHLGADALQGVEGRRHLVDGGLVPAGLEHDDPIVRAEVLAGLMQAHPQLDVAAVFGQRLLQVQGVGVAVVHPQADDIIAVHGNDLVSLPDFPKRDCL